MANGALVLRLGVLVIAMFGFGYALVPLYDAFCEVTGLNGKTAATAATVTEAPDLERTVRVEFLSNVSVGAPWEFRPAVTSMEVHPGKLYGVSYVARNKTQSALVATATPSVTPGKAAAFFQKTECFCFTEQAFAAGEEKDMPVRFILDPDLPAYIDSVSLSYTFFEKS